MASDPPRPPPARRAIRRLLVARRRCVRARSTAASSAAATASGCRPSASIVGRRTRSAAPIATNGSGAGASRRSASSVQRRGPRRVSRRRRAHSARRTSVSASSAPRADGLSNSDRASSSSCRASCSTSAESDGRAPEVAGDDARLRSGSVAEPERLRAPPRTARSRRRAGPIGEDLADVVRHGRLEHQVAGAAAGLAAALVVGEGGIPVAGEVGGHAEVVEQVRLLHQVAGAARGSRARAVPTPERVAEGQVDEREEVVGVAEHARRPRRADRGVGSTARDGRRGAGPGGSAPRRRPAPARPARRAVARFAGARSRRIARPYQRSASGIGAGVLAQHTELAHASRASCDRPARRAASRASP